MTQYILILRARDIHALCEDRMLGDMKTVALERAYMSSYELKSHSCDVCIIDREDVG